MRSLTTWVNTPRKHTATFHTHHIDRSHQNGVLVIENWGKFLLLNAESLRGTSPFPPGIQRPFRSLECELSKSHRA